MKTIMILAAALIAVQGCSPGRRDSAAPPATHAASSDEHALETLRDLGVTPEVMLQLVRNHLAAATNTATPGQPPPAPIAEPEPPATPLPVVQLPEPVAPAPPVATAPLVVPPPVATSPEPPAASATPPPPPAKEWPYATDSTQPADATTVDTVVVQQPVAVQQTQDFYTPLNNYGRWFDVPAYGRVWQPTVTIVVAEWRPYRDSGHWILTDCGWYWQSDYSWGWAPFHYGRWCYMDRYRWIWVPDTVWAPAWVSWRRSETHYGWAPLPPGTTFQLGVGFTFDHETAFDAQFGLSSRHYTFVPNNHLGDRNLASVIIRGDHVDTAYRESMHIDDSHAWNDRNRRVQDNGPGREAGNRANREPARLLRIVTAPPAAPVAPRFPVARPVTPAAPVVPAAPPVTMPVKPAPKSTSTPVSQGNWPVQETQQPERRKESPDEHKAPQERTPPAVHLQQDTRTLVTPPVEPHEATAPVVPVTRPVAHPWAPVVTEPATHDVQPVEIRHTSHEPRVESPPAALVAVPKTDPPDKSPGRTISDRTHADDGDDPAPARDPASQRRH